MAQMQKITNDMTVLAFKNYTSSAKFPFIGENFAETMTNVMRYSLKNNVNIADVVRRLANANFHTNLVARVYGDVRRMINRLEKVLIPSLLLSFIDSSLSASGLSLTKHERTVVSMLHMAIFKQWNALIATPLPATITRYDKLIPTIEDLVSDMVRVTITQRIAEFKLPDLPSEKISAPLVAQTFLEIYSDIQRQLVTVNNVQAHVQTVLASIKGYINDNIVHVHLLKDPQFMALANNLTLLTMAAEHSGDVAPSRYDGWFASTAISEVTDYLLKTDADIQVYSLSEIASTLNVTRSVNDNTKQLKGVLITPNYNGMKWIQWFHRNLSYGSDFVRMITFRDPTSVVTNSLGIMPPDFVESQVISTMLDMAQYDNGADASLSIINLLPPAVARDLMTIAAAYRSNFVKMDPADDKKNVAIEFYYELDDSIVSSFSDNVIRMDTLRVARTYLPEIVCAYSKKQISATSLFPIKSHTLEIVAKDSLLPTELTENHSFSMDAELHLSDSYLIEGVSTARSAKIKLSDFLFNGDPISLISVAFSPHLTESLDLLLTSWLALLTASQSVSHIKVRAFTTVWNRMRTDLLTGEFEWLASNYRRHIEVPINPRLPQDATNNYLKSMLAMFKFTYILGTSANSDLVNDLVNTLFDSKVDIIGLMSDQDIRRLIS